MWHVGHEDLGNLLRKRDFRFCQQEKSYEELLCVEVV